MFDPARSADVQRWFDESLSSISIMAVLRGLDPETTVRLANVAWDLGCEHVEIPIESTAAVPSLVATIQAGLDRGKVVGAGTILTPEQADLAIELGAAYLVSPGLDAGLIVSAVERDVPFLPGVSTPTEILAARKLGLRWLKAFPGSLLGPEWITAMHGPFPEIRFVVTGGMNGKNAAHFLRAGCSVVGVGSAFDDPEQHGTLRELVSDHG
jgi:2-dehydro-3-deoxyphosphogluconate aldolase/(4S)-4-hydroxy-2-oxoglutarate aldolase